MNSSDLANSSTPYKVQTYHYARGISLFKL